MKDLVPLAAVALEEGHVLHDGHSRDLHLANLTRHGLRKHPNLVEHALAAADIIFGESSTSFLSGFSHVFSSLDGCDEHI